jgi:hypothetical protein
MDVDAGMVAAQMFKTNRLTEGIDSGDFGEVFDHSWETRSYEVAPTALEVDTVKRGLAQPVDTMRI